MASSSFAQPQSNVSGALTEVSAIRALESHLYCNPEGTLWAQQMQRITNFAIGEVDTTFSGASNLTDWSELFLQAELQRAGDLIMDSEICFTLSSRPNPVSVIIPAAPPTIPQSVPLLLVNTWTPAVGYAAIKYIELLIGQQKFNAQTRESLIMYDEIHKAEGKRSGMSIGDYGNYLRGAKVGQELFAGAGVGINPIEEADEATLKAGINFSTRSQNIIASLPFFYCQATGNALNIIGLQQHQVTVNLTLTESSFLAMQFYVNRQTGEILSVADTLAAFPGLPPTPAVAPCIMNTLYLRSKYVYLDTMERRVMAQQPLTRLYVTEQLSEIPVVASDIVSTLSNTKQSQNFFNLGVIDYSFAFRLDSATNADNFKQFFSFGAYRAIKNLACADAIAGGTNYYCQEMVSAIGSIAMQVNNYTRFNCCDEYLRFDQPRKRASRTPTRIIQYYSFAVHASAADEAISGSFNLSAIDNVVFVFAFKPGNGSSVADDHIVAKVYGNVYDGMGNIAVLPIPGRIYVYARNYNVYKQAAGMIGSQFAN